MGATVGLSKRQFECLLMLVETAAVHQVIIVLLRNHVVFSGRKRFK